MNIRPRTAADVEACARILVENWDRDRYPIYLPDDITAFVDNGEALGAWVATDDAGQVVGHVALHPRSWDGIMDVVLDALGCAETDVAVVARLMVAPDARRAGTGRALLGHATRAAEVLGRRAVLDVAVRYGAAIAMYEQAGWRRIGTAAFPMPDGSTMPEIVYVGPHG